MGVHNSAGAGVLEQLGVRRVILERQITTDELETLRNNTAMELEVFVHGALCCSLSGSCLFSSWLGGWSGNRGKCKQPCRRRYFSGRGNGFFFSPNDLSGLDDMQRLKTIGISALKIEGRLKKTDYVVPVVKAYRMMLDASPGKEQQLLQEARGLLSQSGGRFWSSGFRTKEAFASVIDHKKMGVSGFLIGKTEGSGDNGFFITPKASIYLGDELRVQPTSGEEGPSFYVTKIRYPVGAEAQSDPATKEKQGHRRSGTAGKIPANRTGFIYCDKDIPNNGRVYKIGRKPEDYSSKIEGIRPFTRSIFLSIALSSAGLDVSVATGAASETWEKRFDVEEAKTRPIPESIVVNEFRKVKTEELDVAHVDADIEGDLFLQQKDIRKLRQEFSRWLEKSKDSFLPHQLSPRAAASAKPFDGSGPEHMGERRKTTTVRIGEATGNRKKASGNKSRNKNRESITAIDIEAADTSAEEIILPNFCSEHELDTLTQKVKSLYDGGIRRFRIGSLYGFALLRGLEDITIIAGFPLPAANRYAFYQLFAMGAAKVQIWIEVEKEIISSLSRRFKSSSEIYTYGRPPLLQTRAEIPVDGTVRDNRGNGFIIRKEGGLTVLYPEHPFSLDFTGESSEYVDLGNASRNEKPTSDFNVHHALV
jgi:putative protease